jgi:hypothetical protein
VYVSPATWEAGLRQKLKTLSKKKTYSKKGLEVWLKWQMLASQCKAFSSKPKLEPKKITATLLRKKK